MEIYIEDFILQNTLINFCLLRLVQITTKSKTKFFLLLLSSLIGAGFSVLSASVLTNHIIINLLKFVCAMLMIKLCFKTKFKQFIINFILLFAYTFAICGLVTSLSSNSYLTAVGIVVANKINLWLIMLFCLIFSYIFEMVAKHIKLSMQLNNLIYQIKLISNNNTIKINAFLDTGNMLNIDGQPVLVLDLSSYLSLTKQTYIDFLLKQSDKNLNLQTVAGSSNLKLAQIDDMQIKINGKIKNFKNQLVAINTSDKFINTNYQALISPAFL